MGVVEALLTRDFWVNKASWYESIFHANICLVYRIHIYFYKIALFAI